VGRVSQSTYTFNYSLYARRVCGVYLPVTLTVGDRTASLILRLDCASTYCVLERPWADYFGLAWESGEPVRIGTAMGGFQAYLHILELQIDRFHWEAPVAIAEFESRPAAVQRNAFGLIGFFDRFRVTIDDQDERVSIEPRV